VKIKLTEQDRAYIQDMADLLLRFNNDGHRTHGSHEGAYGCMYDAINQYIAVEFGVDVARGGVNWGGNKSYADDMQVEVNEAFEMHWQDVIWSMQHHGWLREDENEDIPGFVDGRPITFVKGAERFVLDHATFEEIWLEPRQERAMTRRNDF
jgi:hypothetical protein